MLQIEKTTDYNNGLNIACDCYAKFKLVRSSNGRDL